MAELNFYTGTMDCGKSTLALQMEHTHRSHGRVGRLFTSHDRAGESVVSSRLGMAVDAVEVDPTLHFWNYVVDELTHGAHLDFLVCDEAQFYTSFQIDQLARIADELSVDVFAFGILTDFRSRLFEGSKRLVELADHVHWLQVEPLCWCGAKATHNARTEDGEMVTEGEVIVVGDTDLEEGPLSEPVVGYEVVCRRHHRRRMTAAAARAAALSPDVLPFA